MAISQGHHWAGLATRHSRYRCSSSWNLGSCRAFQCQLPGQITCRRTGRSPLMGVWWVPGTCFNDSLNTTHSTMTPRHHSWADSVWRVISAWLQGPA